MREHLVDRIGNLGHDGTRTAKPATTALTQAFDSVALHHLGPPVDASRAHFIGFRRDGIVPAESIRALRRTGLARASRGSIPVTSSASFDRTTRAPTASTARSPAPTRSRASFATPDNLQPISADFSTVAAPVPPENSILVGVGNVTGNRRILYRDARPASPALLL
jgi:hypothetical protein